MASSIENNHPLPAPPGHSNQGGVVQAQRHPSYQQQQQQQQRPDHGRPRSKSSFSFRSDRSHKSSGSQHKIELTESHSEKQAKRLTSKADPTLAMSEAEPSAVAASGVASSLAPLRAIQHRDSLGQAIAEPDRSNPTRSRWERPLDTIRSFEAAIDGNYSRKSMIRSDTSQSVAGGYNRRSSYYGGSNAGVGGRNPLDSYNGARPASHRPDSYYDGGMDAGYGRPSNGYHPSRQRYPRTASEPAFNPGAGIYPQNGNQQSYETVTTASGSGSYGEPAGYSTDPSSENSSVDRIHAINRPEYADAYGPNGTEGGHQSQLRHNNSYGYGGPNADMPMINESKAAQYPPRVPIKLGTGGGNAGSPGVYEPPKPGGNDKRKSWLGRRFSKKG